MIAKFGIEVDILICGDDFTVGKPNPLPMMKLHQNLNIDSSETLYVGDMLSDFQFAVNSGVNFVFFSGGEYSDINERVLNPKATATNLLELADLLDV